MDFLRDARFGDFFVNPAHVFCYTSIAIAVFDALLVRAVDQCRKFTALRNAGRRIERTVANGFGLRSRFCCGGEITNCFVLVHPSIGRGACQSFFGGEVTGRVVVEIINDMGDARLMTAE